jgi:hypothetical protein
MIDSTSKAAFDTATISNIRVQLKEAGATPELLAKFDIGESKDKQSRLDEPHIREQAQNIIDGVLAMCRELGLDPDISIIVSTLATGQVNALCASSPFDTAYRHVFLDTDTAIFCHILGKLMAECYADQSDSGSDLDLLSETAIANAAHPQHLAKVVEMFSALVVNGTVRAAKPFTSSPTAIQSATLFGLALLAFPLAHEVAHLQLGHLDRDRDRGLEVEGVNGFEPALHPYADEFQADIQGAILTNQLFQHRGVASIVTLTSPYIFLKAVEIVEAGGNVFAASLVSDTHPPANDRAAKVRASTLMFGKSLGVSSATLKDILVQIDIVFARYQTTTISHLEECRAKGVTPRDRLLFRRGGTSDRPTILGFHPFGAAVTRA